MVFAAGVVESALDDRLDGLGVRSALPSDRERAQAGSIHSLSAVLLRAANDAEQWSVAHLGLRVLSARAPQPIKRSGGQSP